MRPSSDSSARSGGHLGRVGFRQRSIRHQCGSRSDWLGIRSFSTETALSMGIQESALFEPQMPKILSRKSASYLEISIARPGDPHIARTVFHGRSNDIWHAGCLCRSPGFGSSVVGLDHRSRASPVTGRSLENGILRPNR